MFLFASDIIWVTHGSSVCVSVCGLTAGHIFCLFFYLITFYFTADTIENQWNLKNIKFGRFLCSICLLLENTKSCFGS